MSENERKKMRKMKSIIGNRNASIKKRDSKIKELEENILILSSDNFDLKKEIEFLKGKIKHLELDHEAI